MVLQIYDTSEGFSGAPIHVTPHVLTLTSHAPDLFLFSLMRVSAADAHRLVLSGINGT